MARQSMASNLPGRTVNTLRYRRRYCTRIIKRKDCVIPPRRCRYVRSFRYFADVFGAFALTARDCAKTSHRKYRNFSHTVELLSANCLDSGWLESPVCPLNRYRVEYIRAEIPLLRAFVYYLRILQLTCNFPLANILLNGK